MNYTISKIFEVKPDSPEVLTFLSPVSVKVTNILFSVLVLFSYNQE